VNNDPVNFRDPMGKEKQLLNDIENGNLFTVEVVARGLNLPVV
jgi:hypothetical protein